MIAETRLAVLTGYACRVLEFNMKPGNTTQLANLLSEALAKCHTVLTDESGGVHPKLVSVVPVSKVEFLTTWELFGFPTNDKEK